MVEFIDEKKKTEFPKDRISSSLFLKSLKKFQENESVEMGCERVGKLFPNKNDTKRCKCAVQLSILGEMPKCFVYEIDENENEYITKEDEFGDERRVTKTEDVGGETVTFYINLKKVNPKESLSEETEVIVHKLSASYPLIHAGFVSSGVLEASRKPANIQCSWEELKNALEGMLFIGKYELMQGKYTYARLDCIIEE